MTNFFLLLEAYRNLSKLRTEYDNAANVGLSGDEYNNYLAVITLRINEILSDIDRITSDEMQVAINRVLNETRLRAYNAEQVRVLYTPAE